MKHDSATQHLAEMLNIDANNYEREKLISALISATLQIVEADEYSARDETTLLQVGNSLVKRNLAAIYGYTDEIITRQEAAKRLGLSVNTITNYVKSYRMIGFTSSNSNQMLIPAWQIPYQRIIPGLQDILEALDDNGAKANRDIFTRVQGTTIFECLSRSDMSKALLLCEEINSLGGI